jgi:hypothetical protein
MNVEDLIKELEKLLKKAKIMLWGRMGDIHY